MNQFLQQAAACLMNRIRVNTVREVRLEDRVIIVKRRRIASGIVIRLGNQFLAWSGSHARLITDSKEWITWERHCIHLLYPERTVKDGPHQLMQEKVPGLSLRQLIIENE